MRSRGWPRWSPDCGGHRPNRCWASAGTRSGTSRSHSSTPRWGGSRRPGPAVRPRRATGGSGSGGCLAIVGYEGSAEDVEARREGASRVLTGASAELKPGAGEAWERERYRGPYLRDALLDAGALIETLETVTFWSSVPRL